MQVLVSGSAVVVPQHSAEAVASLNLAQGRGGFVTRLDDLVPEGLV
jgi:hypothetical protein